MRRSVQRLGFESAAKACNSGIWHLAAWITVSPPSGATSTTVAVNYSAIRPGSANNPPSARIGQRVLHAAGLCGPELRIDGRIESGASAPPARGGLHLVGLTGTHRVPCSSHRFTRSQRPLTGTPLLTGQRRNSPAAAVAAIVGSRWRRHSVDLGHGLPTGSGKRAGQPREVHTMASPMVDLAMTAIVQDAIVLFGDRSSARDSGGVRIPVSAGLCSMTTRGRASAGGAHRTAAVIACAPTVPSASERHGIRVNVQLLREAFRRQRAPRFLQGVNPCERRECCRNSSSSSF
jgi:hypothetical protein